MGDGNRAEALFEAYLAERGLDWRYEDETPDGHKPDYWVTTASGLVVCEVKEIGARLPEGVGSFDGYRPIRKAIDRKREQGAGLKGRHPYCVVLYAPEWPLSAHLVSGAMFGNAGWTFPVDTATGSGDVSQTKNVFLRDGLMRGGDSPKNTRFSAIVALHVFNPTVRDGLAWWANQEPDVDPLVLRLAMELWHQVGEVDEDDPFNPEAFGVRAEAFLNAYAALPMPSDLFIGPHDRQWAAYDGSTYALVSEGVETPRLL